MSEESKAIVGLVYENVKSQGNPNCSSLAWEWGCAEHSRHREQRATECCRILAEAQLSLLKHPLGRD